MQKVICTSPIKDIAANCLHKPFPNVGDIVTVIEVYYEDGHEYFVLAEYGSNDIFLSVRFSPLSDIDETTLVNSKPQLETA
jgi:hypothetical protein